MVVAEVRDLSQHRRKARGTGFEPGPWRWGNLSGLPPDAGQREVSGTADGALLMGKGMNPQAMSALCGAPWI